VKLKPKVPLVVGAGDWRQPDFGATDWTHIEKPYGRLYPDTRGRIQEETNTYLRAVFFEAEAEPLDDAQARVRKLLTAVRNTHLAVAELDRDRDAAAYAARLIMREFSNPYLPEGANKREFIDRFLRSLLVAVHSAREELSSDKDIYKARNAGVAWDAWINRLRAIICSAGLRPGISKRSNSRSPFVVMVSTLQERIPKRYRRHTHSLEALATAMVKAVADARDK
jgi:hypothetical protein